jgi:hypothetical protein
MAFTGTQVLIGLAGIMGLVFFLILGVRGIAVKLRKKRENLLKNVLILLDKRL